MLKAMAAEVADVLDSLPEESRLALWLSCDNRLSREEAAGILSISGARLRSRSRAGMHELLGALAQRDISTDAASVKILLDIMVNQPAPLSVLNRIGEIVGMKDSQRCYPRGRPPSSRGSCTRRCLCDMYRLPRNSI